MYSQLVCIVENIVRRPLYFYFIIHNFMHNDSLRIILFKYYVIKQIF